MGRLKQGVRYFLSFIPIICSVWILQSCIKDNLTHCVNEPLQLVVKVVDVVTGNDITETGELEEASLYLYDQHGYCIKVYTLTASQIKERQPVFITEPDREGMIVSAWGNLGNELDISDIEEGEPGDYFKITLSRDPENEAFNRGLNDFFFSAHHMDEQQASERIQEVVLTQKNAKLHITVRGIQDIAEEDLWFKLTNRYNGYGYKGVPLRTSSSRKEKGGFNSNNEYVSKDSYLLIHSANQKQASADNSLTIALYNREEEMVVTNRDTGGNYITLVSGKTTNVLIDISKGIFEVYMIVTPWNEIHQWETW